MAKYTFVVFTNPVAGKEDEFNDWYNRHHIPDVLNVPGIVSGHRFKLADTQFSRDEKHQSPKWPEGYWPKTAAPPNASAWNKSIQQFRSDLKAMQELVADAKIDLFARIPWGDGQTVLREALLVADHNAYHIAQLVDLRRLLGAWKG